MKKLPNGQIALLIFMVGEYGLRPTVNGLADAIEDLLNTKATIRDEFGEPMHESDIQLSIKNLRESLY